MEQMILDWNTHKCISHSWMHSKILNIEQHSTEIKSFAYVFPLKHNSGSIGSPSLDVCCCGCCCCCVDTECLTLCDRLATMVVLYTIRLLE